MIVLIMIRKESAADHEAISEVTRAAFENHPYTRGTEEFIIKAAALINDEKATAVIEHITYDVLDERYGMDIFTEPTIKPSSDCGSCALIGRRILATVSLLSTALW